MNPSSSRSVLLIDYAWLLEKKVGLFPERSKKVAKSLQHTSMKKALIQGLKSKKKQDEGDKDRDEPIKQADQEDDQDIEEVEVDPKEQEEINELEQKLTDLQAELALPRSEFEQRLMRRLREEVQTNRAKLEEELKKQFILEKKRLLKTAVSIFFAKVYVILYFVQAAEKR